jgi:hypothetical protein
LLKVALNTSNQNQTIFVSSYLTCSLSISIWKTQALDRGRYNIIRLDTYIMIP